MKQYVGMARRAADFRQRYWSDVNLREAVWQIRDMPMARWRGAKP